MPKNEGSVTTVSRQRVTSRIGIGYTSSALSSLSNHTVSLGSSKQTPEELIRSFFTKPLYFGDGILCPQLMTNHRLVILGKGGVSSFGSYLNSGKESFQNLYSHRIVVLGFPIAIAGMNDTNGATNPMGYGIRTIPATEAIEPIAVAVFCLLLTSSLKESLCRVYDFNSVPL